MEIIDDLAIIIFIVVIFIIIVYDVRALKREQKERSTRVDLDS